MHTLTVFTPTYNRAHTLPRTYESLLRQTCRDFVWMVVDDGSTDNTREMVEKWQREGTLEIRYIYKENGGLYTGYNTAYANIDTELCVCIDSDDFMPDDAVQLMIQAWRERGSDRYAGVIGLDFDMRTDQPIGGYFPEGLKECYFLDLYTKKIHIGDTKPVMRTELMRSVAPQVGYEGEKNFNPVYMLMQVCDDYPLLVENRNYCIVDYQTGADSMSEGIFRQYFNSPRSFSKMRRLEMVLKRNTWKNRARVAAHYVATSIIARNRHYISESPRKLLTVAMIPVGVALYFYFKRKAKAPQPPKGGACATPSTSPFRGSGGFSIAIRTLGLNPEMLRGELESIYRQTVPPQKVVIYIADGYEVPDFRVGDEVYVSTKKGMVAQRAVDYKEIDTELIMLLDDDVTLEPDSAERLIRALEEHRLDCISPDTFANHRLPWHIKLYAALSNLTFPHRGDWAFKMAPNGSFSYINTPKHDVYPSQTAAGPCSLWRKDMLLRCRFADEVWLDSLGFAYNDDGLEFYKLHRNGGRLGVHFSAGVVHVGAKTSSATYHRDPQMYRKRAKAQYLVWHRAVYSSRRSTLGRIGAFTAFWTKALWMLPVHVIAAIHEKDIRVPWLYVAGTADGIKYSRTKGYRTLPPYVL